MAKNKIPKVNVPRSLDEITSEYQQTAFSAGVAQYIVFAHQQELERLNKKLLELNQEGDARKQLNQQAASEKKEEVKNEQV